MSRKPARSSGFGFGFEWLVAWRHLRDTEQRSHWTLITGLALLGVGAACMGLQYFAEHMRPAAFLRGTLIIDAVRMVKAVAFGLGGIAFDLGVLLAIFRVFTAFSILGVFFGTAAPIIALSVMSGFEMDLKSKIRATKADVVIARADDQPFTDWREVQRRLAGVSDVRETMAYVESEVIIKHVSNPAGMGIILRGIEPEHALRVLDLQRTLKEGDVGYLSHPEKIPLDGETRFGAAAGDGAAGDGEAADHGAPPGHGEAAGHGEADDRVPRRTLPGILLGEELFAHTLRVYMGSDVDVACPLCGVGPTGPMPKLKSFRVAGHFYSGMYEFDSKLAYVALEDAQKFLGMRGEVTGIEVRIARSDAAGEAAGRIAKLLGPAYEVRSWEELNRGLFMALRLEKLAMFIVLTFIVLVASFSIVSTLIMLATEKSREIAILKSMGATAAAILRIFLAEGLYIGLVGLGLGLAEGIGTCQLLARYGLPLDPDVYYIQKLPVVMRPSEIFFVALAAIGLCCFATLYPAYLASRLRPVEGLRYE